MDSPNPDFTDPNFTGYRIDLEDHAAIESGATEFLLGAADDFVEVPEIVDPEAWGDDVKMQGPMNSCRGHSLATGMEGLIHWEHGVDVLLSPLFAYLLAQAAGGLFGVDEGSRIVDGLTAAGPEGHGVCLLSLCPYPNPVQYPGAGWRATKEQLENADKYRIRSWVNMKSQRDVWAAALQWIGKYGYLDMGIPWPVPIDANGVITRWAPGNQGHAVCGNGKGPGNMLVAAELGGEQVIKIANSHNKTYGKRGYFYFREREWRAMMADRRSTVCGVTSCTSPTAKPRKWDGKSRLILSHLEG